MWRTTLGALFWDESGQAMRSSLARYPLGTVYGWNTLQFVL